MPSAISTKIVEAVIYKESPVTMQFNGGVYQAGKIVKELLKREFDEREFMDNWQQV